MDSPRFEVVISSDLNYEKLIAEICVGGKFVALLNQDKGPDSIRIEFAGGDSNETQVLRKLDLEAFLDAVALAKTELLK